MMSLPVAQQGEAILAIRAALVSEQEFASQWLQTFVEAMYQTMLDRNGVGIAAPQVYLSKRIIIVASRPNPRYPDAPDMPAVVMINPEIVSFSQDLIQGEEGCLSVPNQRGQVSRSQKISLKYRTLQGQDVYAEYVGFPARIIQHEIDHLDGILFVQHLSKE